MISSFGFNNDEMPWATKFKLSVAPLVKIISFFLALINLASLLRVSSINCEI
jgi:hypothetical protein